MINDDKLDRLLNSVPPEVTPSRDLWPQIQVGLATQTTSKPPGKPRRTFSLFAQLAAGFVLIAVTALTTYLLTRSSMPDEASQIAGADDSAIVQEYLRSRTALDRQFADRIAQLPATTRAQLETSLADLRRAENEIFASLKASPSDPLLQELLLSTFQTESQLLADMTELRDPHAENIDPSRSPI